MLVNHSQTILGMLYASSVLLTSSYIFIILIFVCPNKYRSRQMLKHFTLVQKKLNLLISYVIVSAL